MPLSPFETIQRKKLAAGSVLLQADKPVKLLILVHEGELMAMDRLDPNRKRCLYKLTKNSVPGFGSLLTQSPALVTYVTSTPALVSAFPVNGNFSQLIMGKLNLGFIIVRSLLKESYISYQILQKLSGIWGEVCKLTDNTALAYKCCLPEIFKDEQGNSNTSNDPVVASARQTVLEFEKNGGSYPSPLSKDWLHKDWSKIINSNYAYKISFDAQSFHLLRKILSLPTTIQSAMYKADLAILEGLSQQLKRIVHQNINELYKLQGELDNRLEALLHGEFSYAEKLYLIAQEGRPAAVRTSSREIQEIVTFFCQSCQYVLKQYQALQNIPYANGASLQRLNKTQSHSQATQKVAVGIDKNTLRQEFQGSANKLISLLKVDTKDAKNIIDILQKLKSKPSPIESNPDDRKLRKTFASLYTKIYEAGCMFYHKNNGKVPRSLNFMLRYGFFDDELVDDEHLKYLCEYSEDKIKTDYPIVDSIEWMNEIYNRKETTSLDELGLTYFDKLKNENPEAGWKRETDIPEDVDTSEARLHYEVTNFLQTNISLTSGTPVAYLPILNRYQLTMPIKQALLTKKYVNEKIKEILDIDFSAFYREIIVTDQELSISNEFVQEQVYPYFILVPSTGTKAMMWQELSGRNKSSRGRIILPIFATTDVSTLLIQAIAAFRWEIVKTIMGADWNNVGQPSITADYTDYVQFYKKNRDLSPEIKEKLNSEFKRFRTDRDRFANDYSQWVKYEAQGVLKLNKVLRAIFYRHIPFDKQIRKHVSELPAFSDLENRFRNIQSRQYQKLEARYRKFGDKIPPKLKANLEFYSLQ